MGLKPSRDTVAGRISSKKAMDKNLEAEENVNFEDFMKKLEAFSKLRAHHFKLVDKLNILLLHATVQSHTEFSLQIESLKRSGAFIIMHGNENYEKFSRRLEDINEDISVLTSYILRHLVHQS